MITSCSSDEWTAASNNQTNEQSDDKRPQIAHEVSVSLDGAITRVSYQKEDGNNDNPGLNLSWQASEKLGVYIRKTDNSIIYAGNIISTGTQGDTGELKFSGSVSEKQDGEQYIYIHPAPTGETQGNAAAAEINFNSQEGALGSTTHLANYIPLIWNEGSPIVSNQGYAVHLTLTFDEDPGTITKVSLQTMPNVGNYHIFPATFNASTMSASSTMKNELTLNVTSGTATKNSAGKWETDAYLACTHRDINVFRTKFNVKVETEANGTFYNEFRSFPGQQEATSITGLPMLANGKCYNLTTPMSKGAATTIINSQYKVNSLLGMWNEYGKTTDPFGMVKTTGLPSKLTDNILGTEDKKTAFTNRTLVNKSSQGSPTFTWDMVTKQSTQSTTDIKQSDVTYNNIEIVGEATEVYVTFISEYAWSQNLLGYYHYSGTAPTSPSEVLKTIIFPNVSKGGHVPYNKGGVDGGANINPNTASANVGTAEDAPLQEYTTVQLLYNNPDGTYSTKFPEGTTIGFFMMRDPKASSSASDLDKEHQGQEGSIDHTGYQPRPDNTLIDWNSWRLFTNTAWNSASGNTGWWDMNCHNFFCSADVGSDASGTLIPGLALYGAKDDASHNYNYSFSAMLYMVSTSIPESMQTANKAYFNLGTGDQVIAK